MANPARTRSVLIGALAALSIVAAAAVSTVVVQINLDAAPPPPLPPTSQPAPEPTPDQAPPTVTETVTVDKTPTPAPPTVTTTVQPPPPPRTSTPAPQPPRTSGPPVGDPPIFSDNAVRDEVAGAFSVVDQYWIDLFSTWRDPNGNPIQWWTPSLYNGDGFYDSEIERVPGCKGEYDNVDNAFYCPDFTGNQFGFMAWDMEFFRKRSYLGDTLLYVTVAHEMGHAAQIRFIIDDEGPAVLTGTDEEELQADCLAGVTLVKIVQDGYLTLEEGDAEEMTDAMISLGDAHSGEGHGTSAQRREWYLRGYNSNDIEACLGNAP